MSCITTTSSIVINNQIIGCEVNRMIRSEVYNVLSHISENKWLKSLTADEYNVLYGMHPLNELARKIYKMKHYPQNIYKTKSPLIQSLAMFKGDPKILGINKLSYKGYLIVC